MNSAKLTAARLEFLDNASLRLHGVSPAVSAHLRMNLLKEQDEQRQLLETGSGSAKTRHAPQLPGKTVSSCVACGNVLIPGWTCKSTALMNSSKGYSKRGRTDQSRTQKGLPRGSKVVQLQCDLCNKSHEITAEKRKTKSQPITTTPRHSSEISRQQQTYHPTERTVISTTTTNEQDEKASTKAFPRHPSMNQPSSSPAPATANKKRSRSKKTSSLKAMLADHEQKKTSSSTSSAGYGLGLLDLMKPK